MHRHRVKLANQRFRVLIDDRDAHIQIGLIWLEIFADLTMMDMLHFGE